MSNTDTARRQTVAAFLQGQRHPPPGAWTDNRLAQAQHYTGAIYLALSAISEALASAAVWVEQRRARKSFTGPAGAGDDEDYIPLGDHPLSEIVQFPNPHESFPSILGYLALQWGLTGNAPVWFVPGAHHGRPVELYPLPEAVLQPIAGPTPDEPDGAWLVQPYYPTGWAWTYGTLTQRFPRSVVLSGREVRKLRAPHPLIRNDGYSPLTACGVQFDILEAIDHSRHAAMLQGAQLGTIVSIAGMSQDQLDQAEQTFRQRYAGPHNARTVLFVSPPPGTPGDGFRVEQVGESSREMDYANSWEQATKFVLATFGVPPAIAGLQATTGYAEFYAAQIQFHYRISQLARRMADFFTLHLAGPWSRYPGEFRVKIEVPRPRNQDEYKQQMINLAAQGAVSVNELRAAFDLGPVRYGDLPPVIFTQKVQADEFPPPPQPAAGGDMGGMPAPAPAEAPPADTPTGGAPPAPDNPESEGSLPTDLA